MHNDIRLLKIFEWRVPTESRITVAKLSLNLPVLDKINIFGGGLQILLRFQASPFFKDIAFTDPCFVSDFVTT